MSRMEFDHEFNKTFKSASSAQHLVQFDQFFTGLSNYYSEYQVNLKEIIRKLFANIAHMTLSLAEKPSSKTSGGGQHLIDDKCLDEFVLDSDIRMELEKKLECALESARLFTASLTRLRDVIIEFHVRLDASLLAKPCVAELAQIYSCSMCMSDEVMTAKRSVRPCYHSCLSVLKSCITLDFNKFDSSWNLYISERLIIMNYFY